MELRTLFDIFPHTGRVDWIGVRPARKAPLEALTEVAISLEQGLEGDHYRGGAGGKRQVTLIQSEHLQSVAAILGLEKVDPQQTRRNILVSGINLLALHNRRFKLGTAILEGTGYCQPCSRMEQNLGAGGYNAMRGHGGITARVIKGGRVRLGDPVAFVKDVVDAGRPGENDSPKQTT